MIDRTCGVMQAYANMEDWEDQIIITDVITNRTLFVYFDRLHLDVDDIPNGSHVRHIFQLAMRFITPSMSLSRVARIVPEVAPR